MAVAQFDPAALKLGKLPARYDRRTLRLSDYFTASVQSPPSQGHWGNHVEFPMDGNDNFGDCVEAEYDHQCSVWFAHTGRKWVSSTTACLQAYTDLTGFNELDPSTDRGTDMLSANRYWVSTGLQGVKVDAFASVDPLNDFEVQTSIAFYASLSIGLQLPLSAQAQTGNGPWTVTSGPDARPGSWGGHNVLVTGYNVPRDALWVATWGTLQLMTWDFLHTYCDEAYVMLSHAWISESGQSPSGLAWGKLHADLANL